MLSQDPLNSEATFKRGTEWVPNRAQQNHSDLFFIHAKDKKNLVSYIFEFFLEETKGYDSIMHPYVDRNHPSLHEFLISFSWPRSIQTSEVKHLSCNLPMATIFGGKFLAEVSTVFWSGSHFRRKGHPLRLEYHGEQSSRV